MRRDSSMKKAIENTSTLTGKWSWSLKPCSVLIHFSIYIFSLSLGFRSFVPICSSKTSSRPSWSKLCQHSHGERASTLPRTKPKTHNPPTLPAKPRISISPAPKPNSSPTLKQKPSDSLHLPASHLCYPSPLLQQPPPKPSVSPTLTVPTPRLNPSPTSGDSQEAKQPSPVAKERRARSITISNTKADPECSKAAKHDILNQEALLDFTNPTLRRLCPHESQRQAATSQNSSYILQEKVGFSRREKPQPPPRNIDVSAIVKPKSDITKQQEFLPTGAADAQASPSESGGIKFTNVQRESLSVLDGLAAQVRLHRNPQSRLAGFAFNDQSYERMCSERSAALSMTPRVSIVSPNIETRRRRFGFNSETRTQEESSTWTSTGSSSKLFEHESPQKHRLWSKARSQAAQMDLKSAVSQSDCASKDYSCQSEGIDQKPEDPPQCAHRLIRLKTCLVAPHTQEATSKTTFSTPDILSHKHQHQSKSQRGENCSDTGPNQTGIFAPSCHHEVPTKLPEHGSEKCVVSWSRPVAHRPFNTNSVGISSKGVFDLLSQPQHREYQRPDGTTTAPLPLHQPNYSPADRAFVMEEAEDPYYVTMYYPGSVYVGEYRETTWKANSSKHIRDSFISSV